MPNPTLAVLRRACTAASLTLAAVASAHAGIVPPGSSYTAYLAGGSSGAVSFTVSFDGIAESAALPGYADGSMFSVNESQADLGGGQWLLSFVFWSDRPLLPVAGESIFVNVGLFDPIDLSTTVSLVQASTRIYNAAGSLLSQGGNPGDTGRWNGIWPNGSAAGFAGSGGIVTRFELDLLVQNAVPLPATAPLALLALTALGWVRRSALAA